MKEILLEEPSTTVSIDADLGYIEVVFQGKVSEESYKFAYEHALTFAKRNHIKKFFINELQATIGIQSKLWLFTFFAPKSLKNIGKEIELIIARSSKQPLSLNQGIFKSIFKKIKNTLNIKEVSSEEDAKKLLNP